MIASEHFEQRARLAIGALVQQKRGLIGDPGQRSP
jgi:hypothetical protein